MHVIRFAIGIYLLCLCGVSTAAAGVIVVSAQLSEQGPHIVSSRAAPGRAPLQRPERRTAPQLRYAIEVLDGQGRVLASAPFSFMEWLQVPPLPGADPGPGPHVVRLKTPEASVVMNYPAGAAAVRIADASTSARSPVVAIANPDGVEPSPLAAPRTPAEEGKLHLLIIASGYSEAQLVSFTAKAGQIKTQLLTSTPPFSTRADDVSIHLYENTADLGCAPGCYNIDRLLCCDSSLVLSHAAASGELFDEIIVVHNTSTYCGGGHRDLGNYQYSSASTFCQVYDGVWTVDMATHEFGHSFGDLCDEYTYGSEGYSYNECVNCRASCGDWADISSACNLSCDARSDYYRPADSVMLALNLKTFNDVSVANSLEPRLEYFAGGGGQTPTANPTAARRLLLEETQ